MQGLAQIILGGVSYAATRRHAEAATASTLQAPFYTLADQFTPLQKALADIMAGPPAAYVVELEPEWAKEPAFLQERVEISLEGEVLRGHLRVAAAIVAAWLADTPTAISLELAEWVTENQARDDAALTWRRRWDAQLDAHPAVARALEVGPDQLFAAAGLTMAELIAMRLSLQYGPDGTPKTPLEIGRELGVAESTIRSRLQRAAERLRELAGSVGA